MALRIRLSILFLGALGASAAPAFAQTSPATDAKNPSIPVPDEDAEEADPDEPTPAQARPAAFDQRTMHFLIHGRAGAAFPAGSITGGFGTADASGVGMGFGGGIGLGLSRYLVLEVNGGYAKLGSEDGCDGCSASSFDLGLGFSYHLAQGIAFDPWISLGVGFRSATFESHGLRDWLVNDTTSAAASKTNVFTFQGIDFTRLALGGDFYPLPALGIGPYFELDLGTTVSRKHDIDVDQERIAKGQEPGDIALSDKTLESSVYAFLHLGVRITFDPVSKVAPRAGAGVGSRRPGLAASF